MLSIQLVASPLRPWRSVETDHRTDLLGEKATTRIFIWYHTEQSNHKEAVHGKGVEDKKSNTPQDAGQGLHGAEGKGTRQCNVLDSKRIKLWSCWRQAKFFWTDSALPGDPRIGEGNRVRGRDKMRRHCHLLHYAYCTPYSRLFFRPRNGKKESWLGGGVCAQDLNEKCRKSLVPSAGEAND